MDFDLTEEQLAIVDTARAFARDEMMPFARQWDEDEIFPVDTLRQAAALGFGGIYVGADVGGSALSRLDAALIFEELAQGCPSTAAYMSIHNMVAWMIDAYGSAELRRRFLRCQSALRANDEFGQRGCEHAQHRSRASARRYTIRFQNGCLRVANLLRS